MAIQDYNHKYNKAEEKYINILNCYKAQRRNDWRYLTTLNNLALVLTSKEEFNKFSNRDTTKAMTDTDMRDVIDKVAMKKATELMKAGATIEEVQKETAKLKVIGIKRL